MSPVRYPSLTALSRLIRPSGHTQPLPGFEYCNRDTQFVPKTRSNAKYLGSDLTDFTHV